MLVSRRRTPMVRRRDPERSSLPLGVAACVLVIASLITALATWALVSLPGRTAAGRPLLAWHKQADRRRRDDPDTDGRTASGNRQASGPGIVSAAGRGRVWAGIVAVRGPGRSPRPLIVLGLTWQAR